MADAGSVTIACPRCQRKITAAATATSAPGGVVLTVDEEPIRAHMLSHDPHDGQPIAA